MFIVSVEVNGLDPYQTPPKILLTLDMSFLLYVVRISLPRLQLIINLIIGHINYKCVGDKDPCNFIYNL